MESGVLVLPELFVHRVNEAAKFRRLDEERLLVLLMKMNQKTLAKQCRLSSNHHPRKTITTFQAPPIDRCISSFAFRLGTTIPIPFIALRYRRSGTVDDLSSMVRLEWSIYRIGKHY